MTTDTPKADITSFTVAESGKYTAFGTPYIVAASQIYPDRFTFSSFGGKQVGVLILSDPMRFDGKADESAEVFLKAVCAKYNARERELAAMVVTTLAY